MNQASFKTKKKLAWMCIFIITLQVLAPLPSYALTSGPSQPEFSSFEPVATTNMVNEFTGDLTYNLPVINIPGANGGGYAMSLAYHSGTSPEEEASWVGYGWSLNPGAITRNKRGFPDDWDKMPVKYWNKVPKNWTVSVGGRLKAELFSFNLPVGLDASLRYNNNNGFGYTAGVGLQLGKGVVSLGYHVDNGSGSFSVALNPAAALDNLKDKGKKDGENQTASDVKGRKKAMAEQKKYGENPGSRKAAYEANQSKSVIPRMGSLSLLGSSYGIFSYGSVSRTTQVSEYTGKSFTLTPSVLGTLIPIQAGPTYNLFGSYSEQSNTPMENLDVFGYMYSSKALENDVMDYFVEKATPYHKRDKFLGIPFNNVDSYTISGEGIGGGFRMYNKKPGHYFPNKKESHTDIFNLGFEIEAGLNLGGGGDIGFGVQDLSVEGWSNLTSFSDAVNPTEDEATLFRFNNDLGGEVNFFNSDDAQKASINYTSGIIGGKSFSASLPSGIKTSMNDGARSLRSSFIGFSKNKDFSVNLDGISYKTYSKQSAVEQSVKRTNLKEQIGEFSVVNEDGNRYVYGLPVFSRKERNLQFGLEGLDANDIDSNYIAYKNISPISSQKIVVGEERDLAYATTYLLTEITDSDYLDRTNDGPSMDDFGGWTKFNYTPKYSSFDKTTGTNWYKWRIPYNGLLYSRNELSDPEDDMGSLIDGEKEVYYLSSIETKTHIALFFTSDREDGLSAHANDGVASGTPGAKGNQRLSKLDKIELWAKDELGNPAKRIKRVCFEYDYSLCGMVPNNSGNVVIQNGVNINAQKGKLTLKKLWFENDEIVNAKISPYVFNYNYPISPTDVDYPARYSALENFGSGLNEIPNYSAFDLDVWGNYQQGGGSRFQKMRPWVNQDPPPGFDPAAWQLKVIGLPSGGEIHVQYDQDDYCYVQDQPAHAMVSLVDDNLADYINKYYLNYTDLGLTFNDLPQLKALINSMYVVPEKKMYFKFLYKLIGGPTDPELEDCNAEYVTGYVNVKEVEIDNGGIYVKLGLPGLQGLHDLPRKVCEDLVKTQKAGKLSIDGSICDASVAGVGNSGSPENIIMSFVGFVTSFTFPGSTCNEVNLKESYLRIPLIKPKKGGGVRVKRILMYDRGLDSGNPQLFGNEYLYETRDPVSGAIISSGVATNEPQAAREENVLIEFMDRFKQSFISKAISGRDKKQMEGKIGESVMPGPSVGYSKVIIKNIHSGKTNPGFSVKEFYTAKDYPFASEMTELDNSKKDNLTLPLGLVNRYVNNQWLSQGFSFTVNSMHGQMKSESTYGGDYSDIHNPALTQLSSLRENTYFEPGEQVEFWNGFDEPTTFGNPGKEEELIFESSKISDINNDGNVEFDVDVGFFGVFPLPFASAFPALTFAETELYTHKTVKIIRYPAIVKSIKTYQDGIYHFTRNKYFDSKTGQAIVTETTDGYHDMNLLSVPDHAGNYTNFNIPAHQQFPATGQKAKNERKTILSGTIHIKKIIESGQAFLNFSATPPNSVCDAMNNFTAGDLVQVGGHVYHLGAPAGSNIPLFPIAGSVVGATIDPVDVEIAKSGRTNQLNSQIGSVITYGKYQVNSQPIPAAILNPRNQFANLLNNALNNGTLIYPNQIFPGLQFIDENGNCGPFPADRHIIIENGVLKIIGPVTPPIVNIVGTPTNPHPMVTALNDYFGTYFDYGLDPTNSGTDLCFYGTEKLEQIPNSITLGPDVQFMQNDQNTVLNLNYSAVNGGTHSIADFFKDVNIDQGFALTRYSNLATPIRQNKCVLLEELSSGNQFGICEGCTSDSLIQVCSYLCESEHCAIVNTELAINTTPPGFGETIGGDLYVMDAEGKKCELNIKFYDYKINIDSVKCAAPLNLSGGGGTFEINPENGRLVFYSNDNHCYPQPLDCIQFCEDAFPSTTITNVVASNAMTLSDIWDYNDNLYYPVYSANYNEYEKGKRGKWRAQSNFVFKEDIAGISAPFSPSAATTYNAGSDEKVYNAGVYELEVFNWKYELANNDQKWLKLSTTTQYSPDGNALEDVNILGVKSTAKFGYRGMLPYLVAQNSAYPNVLFESFENKYQSGGNTYLEDGLLLNTGDGTRTTSVAHSGIWSLKLKNDPDGLNLVELQATDHILNEGLSFKVWVKTDVSDHSLIENNLRIDVRVNTGTNPAVSAGFRKIAQSGEWSLYESRLVNLSPTFSFSDLFKISLKFDFNNSGVQNIWIDDLRMQPLDAQVTCYVYDVHQLRLITTFDDQHFGLYYQYNEEGKLVRKLIETERGMKTVQETQYNTPKVDRN